MKQDAIERRNEFERKGEAYTPAMVLKPKEILTVSNDDLKALIDKYTVALSPTTCKVWKSFYNSFLGYIGKNSISVNEISLETVKGYANHLEKSKMKESTIKMTLSKLAAILKFAVEEGVINDTPFRRFNYGKIYKISSSTVFIHHRSIEVMKEMFLKNVIIVNDGGGWYYNDDAIDILLDSNSKLFACYFWLCGMLFQGLAPIDLCQIKVKDLDVINIDGEMYYSYDTKRQKTGIDVRIRIKKNTVYSNVMIRTLLMFRKSEYFLPILDGVENDHLKIYKRVSNWLTNHIDKFREWIKEVNAEIIKRNVENKDDIPLIPDNLTFYSYRHSYAQAYLANGGNVLALATLLGRSMDTISTYVEQLSRESDLAKAVNVLG